MELDKTLRVRLIKPRVTTIEEDKVLTKYILRRAAKRFFGESVLNVVNADEEPISNLF